MTVYVVNGTAPSNLPAGTLLLPNIISNVVNVTFSTSGSPTTFAPASAAAATSAAAPVQTPATSAPPPATPASTQAPTPAPTAASKTVQASIVPNAIGLGNQAYTPDPININVGDTVVWTNQDSIAHTVTSASSDGSFTSSPVNSGTLGQGKTFSQTFTSAGTFTYGCQIHGFTSMNGQVVVT
jgi:plastocyanin